MRGRDREQKEKIHLEKHKGFSDTGKLLPFPKGKGEPENAKPVPWAVRNAGDQGGLRAACRCRERAWSGRSPGLGR